MQITYEMFTKMLQQILLNLHHAWLVCVCVWSFQFIAMHKLVIFPTLNGQTFLSHSWDAHALKLDIFTLTQGIKNLRLPSNHSIFPSQIWLV